MLFELFFHFGYMRVGQCRQFTTAAGFFFVYDVPLRKHGTRRQHDDINHHNIGRPYMSGQDVVF
jgi:hypothetical protein